MQQEKEKLKKGQIPHLCWELLCPDVQLQSLISEGDEECDDSVPVALCAHCILPSIWAPTSQITPAQTSTCLPG